VLNIAGSMDAPGFDLTEYYYSAFLPSEKEATS